MTVRLSSPAFRLALLLAAMFGFSVLTLREGHSWGGDFSQYILHARNIATGIPYAETGYLYNPENPDHGPRIYPPVFPALLAPVYAVFGLNFTAMKVTVQVFATLGLGLVYWLARRGMGPGLALWVVAITGFSPTFRLLKDEVLPDGVFLFFSMLALCGAILIQEKGWDQERPLMAGAVLGVAGYLAYGCRGAGIVLLPALLLYDVVRRRRITRFAVATGLTFTAAAAMASVSYSDPGYVEIFLHRWSPRLVLFNAVEYTRSLVTFWDNGYVKGIYWALGALFSALAAVAGMRRLRAWSSPVELYLMFYLGLLLIWPSGSGWRYLYPVYPLYVLLVMQGVDLVGKGFRTMALAILLIAGSFAGRYSRLPFGPQTDGIRRPSFVQLCAFIRDQTSPDDRFVFWNPRVLSLLTGRQAGVYSLTSDPDRGWSWVKRSGARYVVQTRFTGEDRLYLAPMMQSYGHQLQEVFSNTDFLVYRVR